MTNLLTNIAAAELESRRIGFKINFLFLIAEVAWKGKNNNAHPAVKVWVLG